MSWDKFFTDMAQFVSTKSKDRSTKVGAVIVGPDNEVLSVGYNGFPRGFDDDDDTNHERPLKYKLTAHAETNAIFNAARQGISLNGSRMYINFDSTSCCTECTKAIIQSGITTIIGPTIPFPGKGSQWSEDVAISLKMLRLCGVTLINVD